MPYYNDFPCPAWLYDQPNMRYNDFDEDPITAIRRRKKQLKELEEEFKEKKDDKKKSGNSLTVGQLAGLLFWLSIPVGISQIYLLEWLRHTLDAAFK